MTDASSQCALPRAAWGRRPWRWGSPPRRLACSSTPPPGTAPWPRTSGAIRSARWPTSPGAEAVAAVRTEHPSGIGVVAGLSEPDLVGLLPSGLGAALARECRSVAGTTVFDLGRPGSPFAIETARCTDTVALVLTPDALAATAAAATIGTLVRRGVDPNSVVLVVNRWRGGDALPLRAIEATAGARVLGVVREDADCASRFSNSGAVPPVKRRGLGRDLSSLADRLAG